MNLVRRIWRRKQAFSRARRIRAFRRGAPKLGCHRCWYDCYGVEAASCPECGADINRDAPWYEDGRYSLRVCAGAGAICLLLSISAFVASHLLAAQRGIHEAWMWLAMAFFWIPIISGGIVIPTAVEQNVRDPKHKWKRHAVASWPMAIWFTVYLVLMATSVLASS